MSARPRQTKDLIHFLGIRPHRDNWDALVVLSEPSRGAIDTIQYLIEVA